jgi:hypothetical protein
MLQLPGHPRIDKDRLVGGCVRLPLAVDAARLRDEAGTLPASLWGSRGGRVGVHRPAEAIFLRGYAPAEGDRPIEDREPLSFVPYIRELIEQHIPAPPMRCLLAKLSPRAVIAPHIDRADYFDKTLRLHFPIETDDAVVMLSRGLAYRMRPGEVWVLNNSNVHAVVSDWDRPRTHLICDFLPTPALERLIAAGEHGLGRVEAAIDARLTSDAGSQAAG